MVQDQFGRHINYLRLSVTDRCNMRCIYCLPREGIALKPHSEILSLEDLALVAETAGRIGFTKIKITGGEPLIRRNLEYLVAMIARTGYYTDIGMTTNGALLTLGKARALKEAGLHRVNISMDTLDPEEFRRITRWGDIRETLRGIDAALEADLRPIKINMVVTGATTEEEREQMRRFCDERGLRLQTIRRFSLEEPPRQREEGPSEDRPPRCESCNRLRVTADGHLKSCLLGDREIKVDLGDIENSLRCAVWSKPECGRQCSGRTMSQIGG